MNDVVRNLDSLRAFASRGLIALLWLHVPITAAIGMLTSGPLLAPVLLAALFAAVPILLWWRSGSTQPVRLTVAVSLIGMVSLLVGGLGGQAWQMDSHMYFFAALAILSVYCDWRVMLMGAVATALHHLLLNFVMPALLFPAGADFGRVVLHAIIVILETGALGWLTYQMAALFALSEAALAAAQAATDAVTRAGRNEAAAKVLAVDERRAATMALAARFEETVGSLVSQMTEAARDVNGHATIVANSASQAATQTEAVVAASAETADGIDLVLHAADDIAASVREVTQSMARATQVASHAVQETAQTDSMVRHLAASAESIGRVVALIRGIAGQTNLLALNATIEAARAGETGKGFAVVAGEVKALATQTARATEDIQAQMNAIQAETLNAVQAIGSIAATVAELGNLTDSVAAAMAQQAAAMQAVVSSAARATAGSARASAILGTLAGTSAQSTDAAGAGQQSAQRLSDQCDGVSSALHGFIAAMRAA